MRSLICVKYSGRGGGVTCEWNGKKYHFTKRNPEKEMPIAAYNHLVTTGGLFIDDFEVVSTVVPAKEMIPEIKKEVESPLDHKIDEPEVVSHRHEIKPKKKKFVIKPKRKY